MNGLILVDKPTDMTSFGVVARIRRITGEKCGHSGTLDPLATGLLPVLVGKGTKLCELLTAGEKSYRGTLRFGLATDTGDISGNAVEEMPDFCPAKEEILGAIPAFLGEITQQPPAYSAIKVDGVPLYRHARRGRAVEVPTRQVIIRRFELLDYDPAKKEAIFEVDCSKGTYIRSLFADLAGAMGGCGTMAALKRLKTSGFDLKDATPLEELMKEGATLPIIPLEEVLSFLPRYQPADFFATLLKNGCEVSVKKLKGLPLERCTVWQGENLLGIGEILEKDGETLFKVATHL